MSEEARKKQSERQMGQIGYFAGKKLTNEHKEKLRKSSTGRRHTIKSRKKMSEQKKAEWKTREGYRGEILRDADMAVRQSLEYRLWREAIFARDNWTCVWCMVRGGALNADHIKPFSSFPELRLAIDNGRTLCVKCHRKTDTYGKKINKKLIKNK